MKYKKLVQILPFLITILILINSWYRIISSGTPGNLKQQIALWVVILNIAVYLINFRYGIIITGLILFLATIDLIEFFPITISYGYFLNILGLEIKSPSVEWKSLLIMTSYLIFNGKYLINAYHEYKSRKSHTE